MHMVCRPVRSVGYVEFPFESQLADGNLARTGVGRAHSHAVRRPGRPGRGLRRLRHRVTACAPGETPEPSHPADDVEVLRAGGHADPPRAWQPWAARPPRCG